METKPQTTGEWRSDLTRARASVSLKPFPVLASLTVSNQVAVLYDDRSVRISKSMPRERAERFQRRYLNLFTLRARGPFEQAAEFLFDHPVRRISLFNRADGERVSINLADAEVGPMCCDNCDSDEDVRLAGGGFADGCEGWLCFECRNPTPF